MTMPSMIVKAFETEQQYGFFQVMDTKTSESVQIYVPKESLPVLTELMSEYVFKKGDAYHFQLEATTMANWFTVDSTVTKIGYRGPWKMWFVACGGALTLPAELKASTGDARKKHMNTMLKGDGLATYYEEVIRGARLSQEIQEVMWHA
jgi:hypothetical protein